MIFHIFWYIFVLFIHIWHDHHCSYVVLGRREVLVQRDAPEYDVEDDDDDDVDDLAPAVHALRAAEVDGFVVVKA